MQLNFSEKIILNVFKDARDSFRRVKIMFKKLNKFENSEFWNQLQEYSVIFVKKCIKFHLY